MFECEFSSYFNALRRSGLIGMFDVWGRTGPPTLGGGAFWTLKIPYKLTCQFERLWCLDYGANTDINDVEWNWVCFKKQKCCNQMRFASIQCSKMRLPTGLRPWPRWGSFQRRGVEGKGGKGKGREGREQEARSREEGEGKGRLIVMRSWNMAADGYGRPWQCGRPTQILGA